MQVPAVASLSASETYQTLEQKLSSVETSFDNFAEEIEEIMALQKEYKEKVSVFFESLDRVFQDPVFQQSESFQFFHSRFVSIKTLIQKLSENLDKKIQITPLEAFKEIKERFLQYSDAQMFSDSDNIMLEELYDALVAVDLQFQNDRENLWNASDRVSEIVSEIDDHCVALENVRSSIRDAITEASVDILQNAQIDALIQEVRKLTERLQVLESRSPNTEEVEGVKGRAHQVLNKALFDFQADQREAVAQKGGAITRLLQLFSVKELILDPNDITVVSANFLENKYLGDGLKNIPVHDLRDFLVMQSLTQTGEVFYFDETKKILYVPLRANGQLFSCIKIEGISFQRRPLDSEIQSHQAVLEQSLYSRIPTEYLNTLSQKESHAKLVAELGAQKRTVEKICNAENPVVYLVSNDGEDLKQRLFETLRFIPDFLHGADVYFTSGTFTFVVEHFRDFYRQEGDEALASQYEKLVAFSVLAGIKEKDFSLENISLQTAFQSLDISLQFAESGRKEEKAKRFFTAFQISLQKYITQHFSRGVPKEKKEESLYIAALVQHFNREKRLGIPVLLERINHGEEDYELFKNISAEFLQGISVEQQKQNEEVFDEIFGEALTLTSVGDIDGSSWLKSRVFQSLEEKVFDVSRTHFPKVQSLKNFQDFCLGHGPNLGDPALMQSLQEKSDAGRDQILYFGMHPESKHFKGVIEPALKQIPSNIVWISNEYGLRTWQQFRSPQLSDPFFNSLSEVFLYFSNEQESQTFFESFVGKTLLESVSRAVPGYPRLAQVSVCIGNLQELTNRLNELRIQSKQTSFLVSSPFGSNLFQKETQSEALVPFCSLLAQDAGIAYGGIETLLSFTNYRNLVSDAVKNV